MNIKLSDNWIRDFVDTKATPSEIAEFLSLTSVSVERMEKIGEDIVYDIEVTQNRPDLMSAYGIAREIAAILPRFGKKAQFIENTPKSLHGSQAPLEIEIINDSSLVGRICAIALEATAGESPEKIKHRLETSGIRSLNSIIDVTNYVMREIGHPTHVFDLDRLNTKKMTIGESKKGETVKTLDGKVHTLPGGDIVAYSDTGEIIDLLGVMGTANSVVTDSTKRILFFIDNNDPHRIRKTSMNLGIRSEAAVLNEKGVDPELAEHALLRGIELFIETSKAREISKIVDIYPMKPKPVSIHIRKEKIDSVVGVQIPEEILTKSLPQLGFGVIKKQDTFTISVPSARLQDVTIEEDIIEEAARIYGYHNIPNELPPISGLPPYSFTKDRFYWEQTAKNYLKFKGFIECYTYSMVSDNQYEGPANEAFVLENVLNSEHSIMKNSLIPSLLEVLRENPTREEATIFELANTYNFINNESLPEERLYLAGIIKSQHSDFLKTKGVVEGLFLSLGIRGFQFEPISSGGEGADIILEGEKIGSIEMYDEKIHMFELNFDMIIQFANNRKTYVPISQYPPIIEDIRLNINSKFTYKEFVHFVTSQSNLIAKIELIDTYKDKKTFRIYYQSTSKNLSDEEILPIRQKLLEAIDKKFNASLV